MHFHHIGIISKDIEKSEYWVKRTHQVSHETDIIFDPKQKVTLCLISCENGINIEIFSGETVDIIVKNVLSFIMFAILFQILI